MYAILVTSLTILANVILGLVIFRRNYHSVTSRLFGGLTLIVCIWAVANYFSLQTLNPEAGLFWIRAVMMVVAVMFPTIYLLARVFPDQEYRVSAVESFAVSTSTLVLVMLSASSWIFASVDVLGERLSPVPGRFVWLFGLYVLIYLILTFVTLAKKLKKVIGMHRTQILIMIWGLVLTFITSFVTTFIFVVVLGKSDLVIMGPAYSLFLVGFVAYAIVKHKFLDITWLVGRAVSYTLLLFAVVGLEAGFIWGLTKILPVGTDVAVVAMIGAVVIVLSYDLLRKLITKLTERIFFQGRYDTEKLLSQLTKVMATEIEVVPLTQKLMTILIREMRLSSAKLLLKQDAQNEWGKWAEKGKIWQFDEMEEGEMKEKLRKESLAIVIPLFVGEELEGSLILGPKASGEIFTERDTKVLSIFATEVAIAVKNSQSFQNIQDFNQILEKRVAERTNELKISQERELQKAEELLRLKDQFVFVASHDLATPVAAISGYMSLIQASKEEKSKELEANLGAVGESVERLKNLVNDLLQISRGESGTIQIKNENIDLKQLFEEVERRVALLSKDKQVKLDFELIPDEGRIIVTDKQKLMEIMENLLTNAIKYRLLQKQVSGWVKVRVRRDAKNTVIEVEDNGFGIATREQSKVFTKFFRSERREVREQPGTGLGLFVSQMLAKNMGGVITFESEEGKGSVFGISLPTKEVAK